VERVQRTRPGIADFENARRDRGFDVFAAPGPGIPFPFTPGRDHRRPLAASRAATLSSNLPIESTFVLRSERLIANKVPVNPVPDCAIERYRRYATRSPTMHGHPPQIMASVAVRSLQGPAFDHEIATATAPRP